MRNRNHFLLIAVSLFVCAFARIAAAQGSEGDTSISYDDETGTVTVFAETTNALDTDYATQMSVVVKDQNGTTVASGNDYQLWNDASVALEFQGNPGSVYTATTNHCVRLQSWSYDNVYPYHQFYYDYWYMSSFISQNIYEPWDYWFESPGWQEVHRTTNVICMGKTYDSVEAKPNVQIIRNGQVIASTKATPVPQSVSVGDKIALTTALSTGTASSRQWSIPASTVSSYVVTYTDPDSPTTAVATALSSNDLSQDHVNFYWVDGGSNRSVTYTVSVNGHSYSATAKFDVAAPTSTLSATTDTVTLGYAHQGDDNVFGLHFGRPDDYPYNPGIRFTATISQAQGYSGKWQWIQIINSATRTKKPVNAPLESQQFSGLDASYPYNDEDNVLSDQDSPAQELLPDRCGFESLSANDSYTMYLMYCPVGNGCAIGQGGNTIWIPLRKIDWSWGGTGTKGNDCNTWSLSNASPTQSGSLNGQTTTSFPQWTSVVRPQ